MACTARSVCVQIRRWGISLQERALGLDENEMDRQMEMVHEEQRWRGDIHKECFEGVFRDEDEILIKKSTLKGLQRWREGEIDIGQRFEGVFRDGDRGDIDKEAVRGSSEITDELEWSLN